MKLKGWRNRIIWGVCLILSLVFISFYGGAVSYGLFFAVVFLPVLSMIYLALVFFRFKIYQELEGRNVMAGEAVPYYFVLQNEDWFSFAAVRVRMYEDFSYVEDVPGHREYELLPGENFRYDTFLVCKYRGTYPVGVREVTVKDFLGLLSFRYKLRDGFEAIVRPKLIRMEHLKSLKDVEPLFSPVGGTAKTEYDLSVRKYENGDSLRRIHWKASAKTGELMSREMTGEEKQGIAILLDTVRYESRPEGYLALENKELELFLALGYFLTGRKVSFDTFFEDGEGKRHVERIDSFPGFDHLYEEMCGLEFSEDGNAERFFSSVGVGTLSGYQSVFFVVHTWTGWLEKLTLQLQDRGVQSVVYVVTDKDGEAYSPFSHPGRRVYVYSTRAKLEEVL